MTPEQQSNRAWLLTAPGSAAIAVVRLAGPGVNGFLREHFSRPVLPGALVHGNLTDAGSVMDDPVVMRLESGAADVCLHGGTWIVQATLYLLRREGFDVVATANVPLDNAMLDYVGSALPTTDDGNAKMVCNADPTEDESEREMLAHLPSALTELAVNMLLRQPTAWREFALANQDVRQQKAQEILADRSLWWLLHPPRVALVGIPNAGKSTLANQLFGTQRSITADLPGTTRDWIGETANLDGLAITLIDTPGLRETSDVIEKAALAASAAPIATADLVVIVLDVSRPVDQAQLALLRRWPEAIVVGNKSDLTDGVCTGAIVGSALWTANAAMVGSADPAQIANLQFTLANSHAITCDALHGVGVDWVRQQIRARFISDAENLDKPRWWTQRQRDWLSRQNA